MKPSYVVSLSCDRCGGGGRIFRFSGELFRRDRVNRGVGLRELARHLGLSPSYLSDLELGRRAIRQELADRLLAGLERLSPLEAAG